jgi:predicted aspartyl protease
MNGYRGIGTALASLIFFVSAVTTSADENYIYRYTDNSGAVRFRAKQNIPKKYRSSARRVTMIDIRKVKTIRTKNRAVASLIKAPPSGMVKRNGLLFTSATFNGTLTKRVIIDTGSEHTILGARLSALIDPQKTKATKNIKTIGSRQSAIKIRLNKVSIGGAEVVKLDCLALDLDLPSGAGAIIGIDFLSRFVFEIDGQSLKFVRLAEGEF